ncbi:MAG: SGNH/GDSL hydrolase family protein [Planctomycetaceae bacterium]
MRFASLFILVVLTSVSTGSAQDKNPLQLTLPPVIYAVPDVELGLYFDNIVLTRTPEAYRFEVQCDLGTTESRRWVVIPRASDVGTTPLTVRVTGVDGTLLGEAQSELKVIHKNAGDGQKLRLLIVGDSLTNASQYPNEIARLFSQPGNPELTMLGTHRPASVAPGVAHEGYGGWTWARFASHYEANPDPAARRFSSPFVFLNSDQQPELNVSRYVADHCGGQPPDYVVFLLGINDCFHVSPDDSTAIDAKIDEVFQHAETLLADFRKAAPEAHFGICVTPAANSRQEAFQANYKDKYTRWGWKRIQHRLVQRQLSHFADSDSRQLSLIPTQINIDPTDGYPENNGVHPNKSGYQQIGTSIYAWLKSRL